MKEEYFKCPVCGKQVPKHSGINTTNQMFDIKEDIHNIAVKDSVAIDSTVVYKVR